MGAMRLDMTANKEAYTVRLDMLGREKSDVQLGLADYRSSMSVPGGGGW